MPCTPNRLPSTARVQKQQRMSDDAFIFASLNPQHSADDPDSGTPDG
jgi:hypothetical protein